MRIAIVHEWLTNKAGSEQVVEQLLLLYPQADMFCTVDFLPPEDRDFLRGRKPRTSFIQRLPLARRLYRQYVPLAPLAIEQHDLSGYDIVISSSHAVAKGVLTGPNQLHICYCHTPMRYAWDLQHQYLREGGLERGLGGVFARAMLHYLRMWDVRTSHGVDQFVANSNYIAGRIRKAYGRDSVVVYPPVDVDFFQGDYGNDDCGKDDYYVAASRLVPYKRVDLIVRAFARMPNRRLVVIGGGPGLDQCKRLAGPNVTVLGHQPAAVLRSHLQRARALVFAAEEDFGILPVEAQACGTPVVCLGRGGARESVIDGLTGVHFFEQTEEDIEDALDRFEKCSWDAQLIRFHAEQFSQVAFRSAMSSYIDGAWRHFHRQVARKESRADSLAEVRN
jgi:glycosyltransferase involved in cell wall biosynthesis